MRKPDAIGLMQSYHSLSLSAMVEITAKVFHGYNAGEAYKGIDEEELKKTKGREYGYDGKEGQAKK